MDKSLALDERSVTVSTAAEAAANVKKYGVAIWRGLASPEITSQLYEPVKRNLTNASAYVSAKYGVQSLSVLPQAVQDACVVPDITNVFTALLGEHHLHTREIYLTAPVVLPHQWHQDARNLETPYAVFVWVAATAAGGDEPGLSFVLNNPGRYLGGDYHVAKFADTQKVISPVFAPGDAFFFDIYSPHKTNLNPAMKFSRIAYKLGAGVGRRP